ncbi:MAG: periplasmic heavy metal sensor [Alphaproteobacteria bacterium]|nr:periplasmic heavy metal sensor [Alphaproteobacteria bacterium]
MNRTVKTFILVSVVLNVLLAGMLIGQFSRDYGPSWGKPYNEKILAALPAEKQAEFKDLMARRQAEDQPIRDEVRALREEALNILKAESFDAAAYQAQIDKIRDLRAQKHQRMADAVKEIAGRWSPQERTILADAMRRPPRPGEKRVAK